MHVVGNRISTDTCIVKVGSSPAQSYVQIMLKPGAICTFGPTGRKGERDWKFHPS